MTTTFLLAFLGLVAALALPRRLVVVPRAVLSGRDFDLNEVERLAAGLSEGEVEARLGPPLSVHRNQLGQAVWRYYAVCRQSGSRTQVAGLFYLGGPAEVTRECRLAFRGGLLCEKVARSRQGHRSPTL